jgi:hypothetical protein
MLGEYCWRLIRDTTTDEYKRQEKVKRVFADKFFVVRIPYKDTMFII